MHNPTLIKPFTADAAIPARTLVAIGAADGSVKPATASTDAIIGVSTDVTCAKGDTCDVIMGGTAFLRLGGNVARGNLITADAASKGIAAAPAVGVNARVIGTAIYSGGAGDIGSVTIVPAMIQGA